MNAATILRESQYEKAPAPVITKYVLGFMFDIQGRVVVLIKKNKPEWQKGKYNGVGGKIEAGESPYDAMQREFREETGIDFYSSNWYRYGQITAPDCTVDLFYAFSSLAKQAESTTSELVLVVPVDQVMDNFFPLVPNLPWLISMAIDDHFSTSGYKFYAKVDYR